MTDAAILSNRLAGRDRKAMRHDNKSTIEWQGITRFDDAPQKSTCAAAIAPMAIATAIATAIAWRSQLQALGLCNFITSRHAGEIEDN